MRFARQSVDTFSLQKILSLRKLDKKAGNSCCECMETISSSLIVKVLWLPIYHKIEGNYFRGNIWVLYKLKTKTSGKGYEIIVLLISVTTLTSDISTHTTSNVRLILSVAV